MDLLQKVQIINSMQASQASKADRKLYIGNLPPGLTQQAVQRSYNNSPANQMFFLVGRPTERRAR